MKGAKVIAGLGWAGVAALVNLSAQLLVMALLARLLPPADFGLMAIASVALRFASYFSDLGVAPALMQKSELTPQDMSAALALSLGAGCFLYLAVAVSAPWFAAFFHADELRSLLPVAGATLVLGPMGSLPIALLRRRAEFRLASLIEVGSYAIGYGIVGVAAASAGLGVWSLVLATLGQPLFVIAVGFSTVRFGMAKNGMRSALAHFWRFGSRYSLIGFLEFLSGALDSFYIGRWIGQAPLGFYNRAQTLASLPVEFVTGAAFKVVLPALSTIQHDRQKMADGYLVLLLFSALASFPLACGISAAHADLVALLLGEKWSPAAGILAIIAMAAPPAFLYAACGVSLSSAGALRPKLALQLTALVIKIALIWGLTAYGLPGIALATVAFEYLRLFLGFRAVSKSIGVRLTNSYAVLGIGIAAGTVVFGAGAGGSALGAAFELPPAARVSVDVACCAIASLGVLATLALRFPDYPPVRRFATLDGLRGRLFAFAKA
jgi:lipopolysaccharide exporter